MIGYPHVLYLHGFRSSPRSFKARVVQERMTAAGRAGELICPQLPASPKAAMELALLLVAATGDEVLDYRDMVAHYAGAHQHVIEGSDHAISEFPQYVDEVLAFCQPDVDWAQAGKA
jgi:predicted esterase YcpF (UPF0227 family)